MCQIDFVLKNESLFEENVKKLEYICKEKVGFYDKDESNISLLSIWRLLFKYTQGKEYLEKAEEI